MCIERVLEAANLGLVLWRIRIGNNVARPVGRAAGFVS